MLGIKTITSQPRLGPAHFRRPLVVVVVAVVVVVVVVVVAEVVVVIVVAVAVVVVVVVSVLMSMFLSHDMVQCGFAVVGFPNIDSMPPGPDYTTSSTTGEDNDEDDLSDEDDYIDKDCDAVIGT